MLKLALVFVWFCGAFAIGADETGKTVVPVDWVQASLNRVGTMTPSEQQAWLRQLEKRAFRAARLALKPEDAARQQAKTRVQLHQKAVTWQALREVIKDTNTQEKACIDRLVRTYRRLVFDTFHKEIETYNERQQAWLNVFSRWQELGSRFDHQGALIDWLEAAIRNAAPNAIGPIPTIPNFEDRPQAVELVASAPSPPAPLPQAGEGRHTPSPVPALPKAEGSPAPRKPEPPLPSPQPASVAVSPRPAVVSPPRTTAGQLPAHRPAAGIAPPDQATPTTRNKASSSPTPTAADSLRLPRHNSQAVAVSPPATDKDALPTAKVPSPTTSHEGATESAVEIKGDELAARIRGCNLAIRALESELDEKGVWTAARLEPLAARLKLLVVRRNDLHLFREAVSEQQRSSIDELASTKGVVSQLAARIVAARTFASGADFKGTDAERQIELKRLDELSRQLAEGAGK